MYTIKQAAARTGIPVELLRAWERRYEIVEPERTPTGYRLYTDASIARLRAMRRLVGDGWSPSNAAVAIREMTPDAIATLAADGASDVASPASPADATELADRFVDAAATMDGARIETVLDEMSAQGTFERVASDYVLPALEALGDAWESGRVGVAGEHAASHATLRRLAAALEAAGRQPGPADRPVIVGLPPGARHELGALAFAVAIRRAGIPVLYLGPDLPITDWRNAAAATSARAAIVGVVLDADRDAAEQVAAAIHEVRPEAVVAFGGRAAHEDAGGRWIRLPDDLREATATITAELERLEPRRARRRGRPG